jgi:hypothetical protein
MWPEIRFYKQQQEIIYSIVDNRETVVVAGNKLGKDFVAAFVVMWFFLTHHPCRIITTSVKDRHMNVLWGEMDRLVQTSKYPLEYKEGGILQCNHFELRKWTKGKIDKFSYCLGMVASNESIESFQGHHAGGDHNNPHSLFVCDEASGLNDSYYRMADTWMDRALIFGNPWPCDNFFKYAVKGNPKTQDPGGDLSWV